MRSKGKSLRHVFVLGCLLCLFSYLSLFNIPVKICSIVLLIISAFIIVRNLPQERFKPFLGETKFTNKMGIGFLLGSAIGLAFAFLYRTQYCRIPFPAEIRWFALTGACIGACEELIFRGYFQYQLQNYSKLFRICSAALAHASYKCCLFLSPAVLHAVNLPFLFTATFVVGLFFGWLKEYTGSILPPVLAHVVFDLWVYADCIQAPWWVW